MLFAVLLLGAISAPAVLAEPVDADLDTYFAPPDGLDCNDSDPNVNPGAQEVLDAADVDEDCDGLADCQDPSHVGDVNQDGDGFTADCGQDCDDSDPNVNPGATEVSNGIDDDCDGAIDEVVTDFDGDGFAAPPDGADCDDGDASIHPGATELANGVDDDCDGAADEGFADVDEDGHLAPPGGGDCNDANPAIHPGATEVMDAGDVDEDCDGLADCADPNRVGEADADTDTYLECGDCDDAAEFVNPGATEAFNGVDDDCDGQVDEGFTDGDEDGFAALPGGDDCDDLDPNVHPGAPEVMDPADIDEDCDGDADCADSSRVGDPDADGDGAPLECGQDCDDSNDQINPQALDAPGNEVDEDCAGGDAISAGTRITSGPSGRTTQRRPRFRFRAIEGSYTPATFECKLDRGNFVACESGKKLRRLSLGKHTLRVRAVDAELFSDTTPAKRRFKVVKPR